MKKVFAITGYGKISGSDSDPAVEVDIMPMLYQRKAAKMLDRRGELALAAAQKAVLSGGWAGHTNPLRRGLSLAVGTASVGVEALKDVYSEEEKFSPVQKWGSALPPLWLLGRLPNIPASHLAIQFQAQGPVLTCLSGMQALRDAVDTIENGEADIMMAGAVEAPLDEGNRIMLKQKFPDRIFREEVVFFVVETLKSAREHKVPVLKELSREDFDERKSKAGSGATCAEELLPFVLS